MRHWFDTPRKKVIVLALVCWLVAWLLSQRRHPLNQDAPADSGLEHG